MLIKARHHDMCSQSFLPGRLSQGDSKFKTSLENMKRPCLKFKGMIVVVKYCWHILVFQHQEILRLIQLFSSFPRNYFFPGGQKFTPLVLTPLINQMFYELSWSPPNELLLNWNYCKSKLCWIYISIFLYCCLATYCILGYHYFCLILWSWLGGMAYWEKIMPYHTSSGERSLSKMWCTVSSKWG